MARKFYEEALVLVRKGGDSNTERKLLHNLARLPP